MVDVQARDGKVYARGGGVSIEMEPETVSRLRSILGDALVAALQQRDGW